MGHKLSKIPSEALHDDHHPQTLRFPQSASPTNQVSAADDADGGLITKTSDRSPTSAPTSSSDGISLHIAARTSGLEFACDSEPVEAAPSSGQLATFNITPKSCEHAHREQHEADIEISAFHDYIGPGRNKIEEAAQALATQIKLLPSLQLTEIIEKRGNETLKQAMMQLCECQSTKCRAAWLELAVQVSAFMMLSAGMETLLARNEKLLADGIESKNEINRLMKENIAAKDDLAKHLQKQLKYRTELKSLNDKLADPQSNEFLRFKNKRLELQNSEIPRLRSRVKQGQADRNELIQLRSTVTVLQGAADTANEASQKLIQLQIAHRNIKHENNSLKKNVNVAETLEIKEKLHNANSTIEEMASTIKTLESKLEAAQCSVDDGNEPTAEDDVSNDISTSDDAENSVGLPKFQLSSKAFNTEAVRALNYINKLNGTVVKRAAKINGEQAGMGWDALQRLEQLMERVSKEGRVATKFVMGMEGAKEAKMESRGFPVLPLGSGKDKMGGRKA